MKATDSRQRTVPVTWDTSARTISPGSLTGLASTLATTGATGGLTATAASACAMASAAGCISAQWKGAETGSSMARRAPLPLAISPPRAAAGPRLRHPRGRKGPRHQRRLRILGERERLGRPVPDHLGELLAERRVDLVEDRACRRKGVGERLAHADRLAALARKYESDRHSCAIP